MRAGEQMTPIEQEISAVRTDRAYRQSVRKWAETRMFGRYPMLELSNTELLAVVKVLLKEDMQ